jgi:hypothetical protein
VIQNVYFSMFEHVLSSLSSFLGPMHLETDYLLLVYCRLNLTAS